MATLAELGIRFFSTGAAQVEREMGNIARVGRGTEAQFKAIEKASGGLSASQAGMVRSLQDQIVKTQLSSREWAVYSAQAKAGVKANSVAGGAIAELARAHHDLTAAQDRANASGTNFANTLTRRFVFGFIALQAKQAVSAIVNLNTELAKVGDTAQRTGIGSGNLQGLQSSAAVKGVAGSEFLDSMLKFNQQVEQAKRGLGDLGLLFRFNGVEAKSTEDALLKVADLVKNAATEADKFSIVQQAGLSATRETVKWLEQGAEAIKRQRDEATKISDAEIQRAREIEESFNKLYEDAKLGAKRMIVEVSNPDGWRQAGTDAAGYFWSAYEKVKGFLPAFGGRPPEMQGPPVAPTRDITAPDLDLSGGVPGLTRSTLAPRTFNREAAIAGAQRDLQNLSILGQTLTATEARTQAERQLYLAVLQGASIDKDRAAILKSVAYENALGITQIRAQIDATTIEISTMGMATAQAESYRLVQAQILENRRRGNELGPEEVAQIQAQADALGKLKEQQENLRTMQTLTTEFASTLYTDMKGALLEGEKGWKAFERAGLNALNKLADRVAQMMLEKSMMMFLNAINPTGVGAHTPGGYSAAFPQPIGSAMGNVFRGGNIVPFARGGIIKGPTMWPMRDGRMGLAGEAGEEVIAPLRRGSNGAMGVGAVRPVVQVNLNVENKSGAQVQHGQPQSDGNGGTNIRVLITDIVRSEMGSGGFDGVMGGRYGSKSGLKRR